MRRGDHEVPAPQPTGVGHGASPSAPRTRLPSTSSAFAQLSVEILLAGVGLRFRAHGGSMSPLLRDGDVVWVRPVEVASVRIGDVVLGSNETGRIVVHRVVGKGTGPTGSWFVLQGDQVARPDGLIPGAQIYGQVETIERGALQIDLHRPLMRALGRLAALRSRWNLSHNRWLRRASQWVGKLPGLSRYLA